MTPVNHVHTSLCAACKIVNFYLDVAELVLDRCIVSNPHFKDPGDINYTVIMNYEFLDDFAIPPEKWVHLSISWAEVCLSDLLEHSDFMVSTVMYHVLQCTKDTFGTSHFALCREVVFFLTSFSIWCVCCGGLSFFWNVLFWSVLYQRLHCTYT